MFWSHWCWCCLRFCKCTWLGYIKDSLRPGNRFTKAMRDMSPLVNILIQFLFLVAMVLPRVTALLFLLSISLWLVGLVSWKTSMVSKLFVSLTMHIFMAPFSLLKTCNWPLRLLVCLINLWGKSWTLKNPLGGPLPLKAKSFWVSITQNSPSLTISLSLEPRSKLLHGLVCWKLRPNLTWLKLLCMTLRPCPLRLRRKPCWFPPRLFPSFRTCLNVRHGQRFRLMLFGKFYFPGLVGDKATRIFSTSRWPIQPRFNRNMLLLPELLSTLLQDDEKMKSFASCGANFAFSAKSFPVVCLMSFQRLALPLVWSGIRPFIWLFLTERLTSWL